MFFILLSLLENSIFRVLYSSVMSKNDHSHRSVERRWNKGSPSVVRWRWKTVPSISVFIITNYEKHNENGKLYFMCCALSTYSQAVSCRGNHWISIKMKLERLLSCKMDRILNTNSGRWMNHIFSDDIAWYRLLGDQFDYLGTCIPSIGCWLSLKYFNKNSKYPQIAFEWTVIKFHPIDKPLTCRTFLPNPHYSNCLIC